MKRTRIPLPEGRTDQMLKLAKKVLDKHIADGNGSLLNSLDWETLKPAIEKAVHWHEAAENYHVQRKVSIEERNKLLGDITLGLRGCRNVLSGSRMKSMQSLGEWGFNVVETTFSRSKAKAGNDQHVQPTETK